MSSEQQDARITRASQGSLTTPSPMVMDHQAEWSSLGMAFEGMCKVGLALTVGFSVAAGFCRLMESGKVKIPSVVNNLTQQLLAGTFNEPSADKNEPS